MTTKGEEYATLTPFQETIGTPLRSEQRTHQLLPRTLSRIDMLTIFFTITFFIWASSAQPMIAIAGPNIYLLWIAAITTFLLPGVLVTTQLNHFMPANGSIYVWTHRALGSLWGFFAGFCAWFPGVLIIFEASNVALTMLQNIGIQFDGLASNWLPAPWQQGLFVLGFILLVHTLSSIPLPLLMKIVKVGALLCLLCTLILGVGSAIWLLQGHVMQATLHSDHLTPITGLGIYGILLLVLFGVEVPFNMAAETRRSDAARFSVRWGTLLVTVAYLVATFGVTTVLSLKAPAQTYTPIGAMYLLFGAPFTLIASCIFIAFLVCAAAVYNSSFARILVAASLDSRLPPALTRVNNAKVPFIATSIQMILVVCLALITYFLVPWLKPDLGSNFTIKVNDMTAAVISVVWFVSMLFLFCDLPIVLLRFRKLSTYQREKLVAPTWVLYLCCISGILASLIGLIVTLSYPFDALFSATEWTLTLGRLTVLLLAFGLIGSAYPRLLSNLNTQTAIARENARLYQEVHSANQQLNQLDRLKDAFLTTASHELRTPLTIVQGYLELLGELPDEELTPELRRNFLERARRACDELVLLQANIMDASNIHFDTTLLHYTAIPLRSSCQAMAELFEPMLMQEKRHIEIIIPDAVTVRADETRLKQVLRNLIANALRYSPDHTSICITATVDHERHLVHTSVIDRGAGIPPDKQDIIFERFVRLERDTHGMVRGSGLGLAICRQLLEAMHGSITVTSSGILGEGSTFTFTLPMN